MVASMLETPLSASETSTQPYETPPGETSTLNPVVKKGLRFWLIIACICSSLFLGALEFVRTFHYGLQWKKLWRWCASTDSDVDSSTYHCRLNSRLQSSRFYMGSRSLCSGSGNFSSDERLPCWGMRLLNIKMYKNWHVPLKIFGRRPLHLLCLVIFAAGCAMCGAANSRNVFLAGRSMFSS